MAHYTKRGDKWLAEVCVSRKRRSKTFQTKREAVLWASDQEDSGIVSRRTLSDALKEYRPIAETHKGYESELSRIGSLSQSTLADKFLESITPQVIASWRDDRLKKVSPVSVRREMIILGALFRIARDEWGWMKHDPLRGVKKPVAAPPRRRGITQAEIDEILSNLAKARPGKQVSQMFRLSLETGMRLSELLSIRWDDVREKYLILRDTKNRDDRHVPLSETARSIVNERVGLDDERLFTMTPHNVSQIFRRASVNGVHFHDARSEAITRLSKKLDVLQLAKMIGHRDIKSLMLYYAEKPEDIADLL